MGHWLKIETFHSLNQRTTNSINDNPAYLPCPEPHCLLESGWPLCLCFYVIFPSLSFLQVSRSIYLPSPAQRAQYQAGFPQNCHLLENDLQSRLCCHQSFFSFLKEKATSQTKATLHLTLDSTCSQGNSTGCTLISPKKARSMHRWCVIHNQDHSPEESQMHLGLPHNQLLFYKITVRN